MGQRGSPDGSKMLPRGMLVPCDSYNAGRARSPVNRALEGAAKVSCLTLPRAQGVCIHGEYDEYAIASRRRGTTMHRAMVSLCLLGAFCASAGNVCPDTLSFRISGQFTTGSGPYSVAVGDFNGDGVDDLAVANAGTGPQYEDTSVSVLLGNGDGTFQEARSFAAGAEAVSVAVGDFNRDGVQDLAVANVSSNEVSVLLGNGDGSFQEARSFGVGNFPSSVAVGDFNRDGVQDVAVANFSSKSISVLLSNGDGSFQVARNFEVGSRPEYVAGGVFGGAGWR